MSALPPSSRGCALPAKMNCTGRVESFSSLSQAILVGEQERAAFVGGETSRETDGENFRIENAISRANGLGRFADAFALRFDPFADELDQAQL